MIHSNGYLTPRNSNNNTQMKIKKNQLRFEKNRLLDSCDAEHVLQQTDFLLFQVFNASESGLWHHVQYSECHPCSQLTSWSVTREWRCDPNWACYWFSDPGMMQGLSPHALGVNTRRISHGGTLIFFQMTWHRMSSCLLRVCPPQSMQSPDPSCNHALLCQWNNAPTQWWTSTSVRNQPRSDLCDRTTYHILDVRWFRLWRHVTCVVGVSMNDDACSERSWVECRFSSGIWKNLHSTQTWYRILSLYDCI